MRRSIVAPPRSRSALRFLAIFLASLKFGEDQMRGYGRPRLSWNRPSKVSERGQGNAVWTDVSAHAPRGSSSGTLILKLTDSLSVRRCGRSHGGLRTRLQPFCIGAVRVGRGHPETKRCCVTSWARLFAASGARIIPGRSRVPECVMFLWRTHRTDKSFVNLAKYKGLKKPHVKMVEELSTQRKNLPSSRPTNMDGTCMTPPPEAGRSCHLCGC